MALGMGRERPGAPAAPSHHCLDMLEDFLADQWLVGSWLDLVSMPHQSDIEWVVQDAPYRRYGEKPWTSNKITVVVNVLMHVPGAQALVIEPGRQLREGSRARGVPAEQLPNGLGLVGNQVDAAGMLRVAPASPLSPLLDPAGLVAEGEAP